MGIIRDLYLLKQFNKSTSSLVFALIRWLRVCVRWTQFQEKSILQARIRHQVVLAAARLTWNGHLVRSGIAVGQCDLQLHHVCNGRTGQRIELSAILRYRQPVVDECALHGGHTNQLPTRVYPYAGRDRHLRLSVR
jgi:hypothetical protein